MGYIKDEHLILECYDKETLEKFRTLFLDLLKKEYDENEEDYNYADYVSPVLHTLANVTYILYIPTDGSKEGWTTSNILKEVRQKFINAIVDHNARAEWKYSIDVLKVTDDEYEDKPTAEYIVR